MQTKTEMPTIGLATIEMTADERTIAERIVNKGRLRASKPAINYTIVTRERFGRSIKLREPDVIGGQAAYVWRMVAFSVSPNAKHHCMPCTADFDLPGDDCTVRRELAKRLDSLVDRIVTSVPKSQWFGIRRWGNVFGSIGSPQVTAEGSIIYR